MSDTVITIDATLRTTTGKGPARRSRMAGKVPAVLLEGGKSTMLEFDPKLLSKAVKGDKKFNMNLGGKIIPVIVHEMQVHPVKRTAVHVDLIKAK